MADKLDLLKEHASEYTKPKKPVFVDVGPARYLAARGRGAPGGEEFQLHVGALYAVAYTLKFASKKEDGRDFKVCPLEGQWWGKRERPRDPVAYAAEDPSSWNYRLMIRVPDFVAQDQLEAVCEQLEERGKGDGVRAVELHDLDEGRCVQMLHVGPYETEHESIATMQELVEAEGLTFDGIHHEIYLSDPRRVPPDRLRTLLRQPVAG